MLIAVKNIKITPSTGSKIYNFDLNYQIKGTATISKTLVWELLH